MKQTICAITGAIGSIISSLFGGWDAALATLCIFMALDYTTGIICAGVFKKSKKTKDGKLNSAIGWKGLCKKGMVLAFVLIAYRLDLLMKTDYIRDGVIVAFITNELISLVENAGLMGLPMPAVIKRAIEVLQTKNGEKDGGEDEIQREE